MFLPSPAGRCQTSEKNSSPANGRRPARDARNSWRCKHLPRAPLIRPEMNRPDIRLTDLAACFSIGFFQVLFAVMFAPFAFNIAFNIAIARIRETLYISLHEVRKHIAFPAPLSASPAASRKTAAAPRALTLHPHSKFLCCGICSWILYHSSIILSENGEPIERPFDYF